MILIYLCIASAIILFTKSHVSISKVDMRAPKVNDIGLIFDVSLINIADKVKEAYEVKIRSEQCCLTLPNNETSCDAAKILGGYFGTIEPAATKIVSIVWPTITLYNRNGYCDIMLVAHNSTSNNKNTTTHKVEFNTMIATNNVPVIMKLLVSGLNFTDCETLDLNPFQKCEPINCEEKYFGRRSFFNHTNKICEPVPNCTGKDLIYDFMINECVDSNHVLCVEEIKAIQEGKFDNNVWDFKGTPQASNQEFYGYADIAKEAYEKPKRDVSSPLIGIWNGLLIITAIMGIYLIICCIVFLLIFILSKRKSVKPKGPKSKTKKSKS